MSFKQRNRYPGKPFPQLIKIVELLLWRLWHAHALELLDVCDEVGILQSRLCFGLTVGHVQELQGRVVGRNNDDVCILLNGLEILSREWNTLEHDLQMSQSRVQASPTSPDKDMMSEPVTATLPLKSNAR